MNRLKFIVVTIAILNGYLYANTIENETEIKEKTFVKKDLEKISKKILTIGFNLISSLLYLKSKDNGINTRTNWKDK